MSNIILPEYNNSILNIVVSILKYYNISSEYPSLSILDGALSKNYKNIVLMVFDGMGTDMLMNNLPKDSFLRNNITCEITSVYPCTTTAAMNSYYTGLSPNEHGWLGWSLFIKEYARIIDIFTNQDSFTKENVGERNAAHTLMPIKTIYEKIHNATDGETKVYTINPSEIKFFENTNVNIKVDSVEQICSSVKTLCERSERKFIFSYWINPDEFAHKYGCCAEETKSQIEMINRQVEEMCNGLKDTIVIISADHGLVDLDETVYINNVPEIDECLTMPPSIEPRAVSFFVKSEMKALFEERFNKMFGKSFKLYSKEEFMQSKMLGYGISHKKISDFIGDYIACATGKIAFKYKTLNAVDKTPHKGQHSGLRLEEMLVPLIIIK